MTIWKDRYYGRVCLVAMTADCKSVTEKHRRFDSYLAHQYVSVVEWQTRMAKDHMLRRESSNLSRNTIYGQIAYAV